ncbi:MAG: CoA-binding protein, partial [Kineosporiaceae bacterium]
MARATGRPDLGGDERGPAARRRPVPRAARRHRDAHLTGAPVGADPAATALDLSRLLAPTSVAVVGATDRPGAYGRHAVANLLRAGFTGRLVAVNPGRRDVLGIGCLPTLTDAGPVDAVVVATPARTVPAVVAEAAALGCGGAVVFAAGFAEAGGAG